MVGVVQVQTATASLHDDVIRFASALGAAARLFTLRQVARCPALAWRSQPVKRASAILKAHEELFDKFPGPYGSPWIFRLSSRAKKQFGYTYTNVDPYSSKAQHWLAFGDLWTSLSCYNAIGIQPEQPLIWIAHPRKSAEFDVFMVYRGTAYLVEVQRSKLTAANWRKKWSDRMKWFNSGAYKYAPWQPPNRIVRPEILLVGDTSQLAETVGVPNGVIYIRDIMDVGRRLIARKQKSV